MVLSFIHNVQAPDTGANTMTELPQPLHPNKVVVIVALSLMFSITFLLAVYVRFCRRNELMLINGHHLPIFQGLTRSRSPSVSGLDKQVIETLPFFKFSSLKGSKHGLECIVCLSQFEDTETLRLLPKCKHAFHMNCIDKWLENHSSCPLCRNSIDPEDIKNFNYSISSRFLRVPSNLTEDTNLEIFVQRVPSQRGSSRFNIGSSFFDVGKSNKEELLTEQEVDGVNWKLVHKFNHKIVVSGVVTRSRWSDLNSSDMLFLNSEMLNDMSNTRFSPLESTNSERFRGGSSSIHSTFNEDENSFTLMNPVEKRSMSEIAYVPRFAEISKQNRIKEAVTSSGNIGREERLRRTWLPIAQRTVQWFSREFEHKRLASNV
ncbi:E3 ubiquitin-protein ligase ATL42-like [Gastrolobium bilobum]|uniref:E3 ubiquitin-protein ligase ATL42-like n=1 Tax=Gastrolobium bilobum TaxID=150636 RepID=UPI002AAFBED1|nr:E3 ubiquitin-protein ligase ATL42-like [Gastrolobium bilobum]